MLRTALKKLFKSTTLIIVFQLTAMPLALAVDGANKKENSWQDLSQYVGLGLTAINAASQAKMQSSQPQNKQQYYEQQFNQTIRLQPNTSVQGIFSQSYCSKKVVMTNSGAVQLNSPQTCAAAGEDWIPGCLVLPAKGNQIDDDMLCSGRPDSELMSGYAKALKKVATDNKTDLDNYLTEGNSKIPSQGKSCYERKMLDFKKSFEDREEELADRMKTLNKLLEAFMLASKQDQDDIKKASALLDGGAAAKELLKDHNFDEDILGASDPSNICGSIYSKSELSKSGTTGGLRGIADMLSKKTDEKSPNKAGVFSASEMTSPATIRQINADIKSLAKDIAKNARTKNTSKPSTNSNARTVLLSNNNAALQNSITRHNKNLASKFEDLASATSGKEGSQSLNDSFSALDSGSSKLGNIKDLINNDSLSIDNALKKLVDHRNKTRKACLSKVLSNMGGPAGFAGLFVDPLVSFQKSKDTTSNLETNLVSDFQTYDNIDAFLEKVRGYESTGTNQTLASGKGQFKTFKVGDTVVDSDHRHKPSGILTPLINNCNNEFKRSGQEVVVEQLKTYAKSRDAIKTAANINIEAEIIKDLTQCSHDTHTGVGALSCSSALNSISPHFCVKTAQKCASNIKSCDAKAKNIVEVEVKKQKALVDKFNLSAENFKLSLKNEIESLNSYLAMQGKVLDQAINLGGIYHKPEVTLDLSKQKYMGKESGFDSTLKMVDPKAYLLSAQKDIKSLIAATKAQRIEYVGASGKAGLFGKEKDKYLKNYRSGKSDWQKLSDDCDGALAAAQKRFGEGNKAIAEGNAKTKEACGLLQAFNQNPESSEVESLADALGDAVQLAAATPMGRQFSKSDQAQIAQIRGFDASCGGDDESNVRMPANKKNGQLSYSNFCDSDSPAKELFGNDWINACTSAQSNSRAECSSSEFNAQANGKIICKTSIGFKAVKNEKKCAKESEDIVEASQFRALAKKLADGLPEVFTCYLKGFPPETGNEAKEEIAAMVRGYNCHQNRKRSGEMHVSVCNANADGTKAGTDKADFMKIANSAASAIGTAVGVSSD